LPAPPKTSKSYTFSGKTIETAFEIVYGGEWLSGKVHELAERIQDQYVAWAEREG
jgi:hypothetical protein